MNHAWKTSFAVPVLALFVLGAGPAGEPTSPKSTDPVITLQRTVEVTGRLWVTGGSTVRSWECEAERLDIRVNMANGDGPLRVSELETAVRGVELHASAPEMDCDNNTMNDHMWDALNAREHAWISFRMNGYDVVQREGAEAGVRISGTLEMNGQRRPVTLEAALDGRPDGSVALTGTHELNMTEWGIRPPRLMMGTLRVHEDVQIHWDLLMRAAQED